MLHHKKTNKTFHGKDDKDILFCFSLAVERAESLFTMCDMDNDGDITEEEFIKVKEN